MNKGVLAVFVVVLVLSILVAVAVPSKHGLMWMLPVLVGLVGMGSVGFVPDPFWFLMFM